MPKVKVNNLTVNYEQQGAAGAITAPTLITFG